MHTPEQAKELWCPMVRVARREVAEINIKPGESYEQVIVGGCNSDSLGRTRVPASCRCIADKCAMWRWEHMTDSVPTVTEGPSGLKARTFETRVVRTHGYCGLAGKPTY
jgi:hypothetical protein